MKWPRSIRAHASHRTRRTPPMIEVDGYGSRLVGPAETEMGRQLGGDTIGDGLNLTLLWREAGSPEGGDPASWALGIAGPLLKAYADYARLAWPDSWWPALDGPKDLVWEWSGGLFEEWHHEDRHWSWGDITTSFLPVALAYALYLDRG